ncbi:MAG: class I SAM-dependent methyltransferase [Bacteroidota bacterium]
MLYNIQSYIKYKLNAKNQHSVHSPFVYDLVTQCFYDKTTYTDYSRFSTYRNYLLQSDETIEVTDLGEGGKTQRTQKRNVRDIMKIAASPKKAQNLMYRLIRHLDIASILELGTSLGNATYAMALANPSAKITTIEGCPNISRYTSQNLKNRDIKNVEFLTGDFNSVFHELNQTTFDLIFFDGNHNEKATINYFETLLERSNNDSVFIFDDIYWSRGMTRAWNYIKAHPKVTVSIDIFFWGIVFFRKEQAKEHFKIRL